MAEDLTIFGDIMQETDMAVRFRPRGEMEIDAVWLPKSQIALVQTTQGLELTLPLWLAKKKGLY